MSLNSLVAVMIEDQTADFEWVWANGERKMSMAEFFGVLDVSLYVPSVDSRTHQILNDKEYRDPWQNPYVVEVTNVDADDVDEISFDLTLESFGQNQKPENDGDDLRVRTRYVIGKKDGEADFRSVGIIDSSWSH